MRVLVQFISLLLIGANIAFFIYIQLKQAQLLSVGIIFSYIFCPLSVIASICAFIGAGKKKPELLLPLLILLSFFIVLTIIVIVGLIVYYLLNEVKGHEGVILVLTYDTVKIPLPISLAICFGGMVIATCFLIITYCLYKSTQRETIRKKNAAESRPLSNRTVLSTDM